MVKDPVCEMEIEEAEAAASMEYQGAMYYFCAQGCYTAFAADPERFITAE